MIQNPKQGITTQSKLSLKEIKELLQATEFGALALGLLAFGDDTRV
jgi:hypothetical protein